MSSPESRRLEDWLDAAGRDAQPTGLGWQDVATRLARTPQQKRRATSRWRTLPLGVAVAASVLLALWWALAPRQPVAAQDLPIEVRREEVELTILSAAETDGETLYMPGLFRYGREKLGSGKRETGQALVKDRRLVLNLKAGDNLVRFTDVAATIDPTSVRFESTTDPAGTTVVEQSYEYDLASADALLQRYLDREVTCVEKQGQETSGHLASFDNRALVLASDGGTLTIQRGALRALRLKELPADLVVRPTLVWKLRTRQAGQHHTVLSYICGFVKWRVDYVVQVTPGDGQLPDRLNVRGWATLENTSGTTYPRAGLRLIAGDLHRLRDPWAHRLIEETEKLVLYQADRDGEKLDPALFYVPTVPRFVERSLFEFHLYALGTPCTVGDRQTKQLEFLLREGVKATRRYVFDPAADTRALAVELLVKNDKDNELGLPLPRGNVILQQRDAAGDTVVLARDTLDHTAVKEEVKLHLGRAFDVVGEHREVLVEKLNDKNKRVTYELKVRNHKAAAVAVRAYAVRLGTTGLLRQATLPHRMDDAQTVYFDFTLPANAEQVIRYTVVYRSRP
jgi:hypothetical protein